jgi:uncharacterized protein YbgA (DUF1722 family)/uncharacterized protein YbbK (DUF523 family)
MPMLSAARPKIIISRCLGFAACRYNGQTIPDEFVQKIEPFVDFVTTCPESDIGLGVPRNPVRLVAAVGGGDRLVQPATNTDVTELMQDYCGSFLGEHAASVDGFILKNRSPSCGLGDVKVYPSLGKSKAQRRSNGLFGGMVRQGFTGSAIEDEGRLKSQEIRHHFLTKLFTLARFRQVKEMGSLRDLVDFQAAHKSLLMAYNQEEMRAMGRIVANAQHKGFDEMLGEYEPHLCEALAQPASCGSHINVLLHTVGYLKRQLSSGERAFFEDTLKRYRAAQVPLSVPLHMMQSYGVRFGEEYLMRQAYFSPYPDDLVELRTTGKPPTCFSNNRGFRATT